MSLTIKALRALTDDEIVEKYDTHAAHTNVGLDYYTDELRRREMVAAGQSNDRLAHATLRLSYMTFGLSVVAVVVAVIALFS